MLTDEAIQRFREGMRDGIFETRLTIGNVIDQLDTQLAMPTEESPYYGPVTMFPDSFSDADRARLTQDYRAMIEDGIYPANRRLRDFLKKEYLPLARENVGLSSMKGGAAYYEYLLKDTTTLDDVTAEGIHQLGLSEVARIRGDMEKVKAEVGFDGSLQEFFEFIRTDPQFKPKSREALTADFEALEKKVEAAIPGEFDHVPEAPLEIRPYEEYREKYEAGGSYQSGTPDGSRPGIFYFNAYDLPSRTTPGQTTLFLHEGEPGHHFQISLAQENEALPNFMRFGGNTAYVEGWALYAESLGYPMGLLNDPYQRFGSLDDEMLRAMRLVVDTGIHAKGWGRDKAIAYMLANSGMGKTDATAEVERYIAIPSQAVAYKIGALTIQRLKKEAQTKLGDRFDSGEFPRSGSRHRRAPAERAGEQDPRLDRLEGVVGRPMSGGYGAGHARWLCMIRASLLVPLAFALGVPCLLGGCIGPVRDSQFAAAAPRFDALAFFEGHSEGTGTLDKMVGKTERVRVSGDGTRLANGSLRLVQHVTEGDKPERKRSWIIRESAPGVYTGTLTDAVGAVTGETDGNRLHLAYKTKGGFSIDQWLYLEPGGRVAHNRLKASKLGVAVARLDETIRKN